MPDDKRKRGQPDRIRIAVTQRHELYAWSRALHVTPDDLTAVVKKVGPMVADVKVFLAYRILKA